MIEKDFQDFIKSYLNEEYAKFTNTKDGKMEVDLSRDKNFANFLQEFEKELINTNINLLYAYHQWLKSRNKINY